MTSLPASTIDQPTILFLDHTARMGGGEIALLNVIRSLDRTRFRAVVVLASDGPLVDELAKCEIPVRVIPLDRTVVDTRKDSLGRISFRHLRNAMVASGYAVRIAGYARSIGASLIHTNSLKADVYGGIAGRLAGIPVVWHVRDNITAQYLPRPVVDIFRLFAKTLPDHLVANSMSTLKNLGLNQSSRASVVYSGVARIPDDALAAPRGGLLDGRAKWPGEPIVAMIGRIAPWKGQHVFLRAAADVLRSWPNCRFWIVGSPLFGEDDYELSLRKMTDELSIGDSVEFKGYQENAAEIMPHVDIVVHASVIGEPFGQVVVEGMAAARPVIATDGGALPEVIIPGENGILVPMGDEKALAGAIGSVLADPEGACRIGAAGRRRVRERFTIEHTVAALAEVFDNVLRRRRSPGAFAHGSRLRIAAGHGPTRAAVPKEFDRR